MRKVEIVDEEILLVKQALVLYRERLEGEHQRVNQTELDSVEKVLKKIKNELAKA